MPTKIEWTDATWNPVTGCTQVSPGCAYCYAKRLTERFGRDFGKVELHPDRLKMPLRWRKPRRVFVVSMGDLFHEEVPDEFIGEVFDVMARVPRHTFQVLTKRAGRMALWTKRIGETPAGQCKLPGGYGAFSREVWPLPNVWLGVSVENQRMADQRIPLLLATPAAVRFVSAEPLLGPLALRWLTDDIYFDRSEPGKCHITPYPSLDWVIAGGESAGREGRRLVERCTRHYACQVGYPRKGETCGECMGVGSGSRRAGAWVPKPQALEWARSLRDQCQAAGVPFFWKQWGGSTPKSGGRRLDRREWNEFPKGGP